MKKINKTFALVAVCATMFTACSEKDSNTAQKQDGNYSYLFQVGSADSQQGTKATYGTTAIEWASTDKIGVYASTSVNQSSAITVGTPCTINVTSSVALTSGDKVYTYFPYSADNASNAATAVKMSIPYNQTNNDANIVPMVGLPYTMGADASASEQTPVGRINFCNLAGGFLFNIYTTKTDYSGEKIMRVVFNTKEAISGDFTYDLTKANYDDQSTLAISGYSLKRIAVTAGSLTVAESKTAKTSRVSMIVAPGSYTGTVQVFTDKAIYTYNIATAKTVTRNTIKTLYVDLNNAAVRSIVSDASDYKVFDIQGISWLSTTKLAISSRDDNNNIYSLDVTTGIASTSPILTTGKGPWAHKLGPDGFLYVASKAGSKVDIVDISTNPAVIKQTLTGLTNAMDIDFDASDNLYVLIRDNGSSPYKGVVYKYTKNSSGQYANKSTFASFDVRIYAMTFDKNGNLLVTKSGEKDGTICGIDMVSPEGTITHIIGSTYYTGLDIPTMEGIPEQPLTARFKQLSSITLDSAGNIYLFDNDYYIKEVKLGPSGYTDATVVTICGNGLVNNFSSGSSANGQVKLNSDDTKLYFTVPSSSTKRPVYVINLK
jgi:hypothetical protein